MLTLEQFKAARATLQGVIRTTSLIHSPALSKMNIDIKSFGSLYHKGCLYCE